MSRIRIAPARRRPGRPAGRVLLVVVVAALAGACASAGGGGSRSNLPILDARNHAIYALQQYGYTVVNDGGRQGDAAGALPERLTVTGERQLQTGWQGDRYATIVMRISLRQHGTGPAAGSEVSVSSDVRQQSMARGGATDQERQQLAAIARRDADAIQKAMLSATTIGFD
jgi:hypothetical protein